MIGMHPETVTIEALTAERIRAAEGSWRPSSRDAVHDGASVGFLPPLGAAEAAAWWRGAAEESERGARTVWARPRGRGRVLERRVARTGRLARPSGTAATYPSCWSTPPPGAGLGRRLLATAEAAAARTGSGCSSSTRRPAAPAEGLYRSAGWTRAGVIPGYAEGPGGTLLATTYYCKALG